ncbi:MAG TPA: hypothetical protein VG605_17695 [Puia sp.]|nr:hypothetical protein [Puia sp.]
MRILLAILASIIVANTTTAQTHLPVPVSPYVYTPGQPLWLASPFNYYAPVFTPIDFSNRHWQLRPYASVSAGMIFLNGAGASYLSAPVGLMLARPLSNNVAAFSSLSVAPTVFDMNLYPGSPLQSPGQYNLGLNPRLEGGLIYTNDARTFSISGSVSVERGSYPVYLPANSPRHQQ